MKIPGKDNVRIEAHRVIKTGQPLSMRVEAEKTARAFAIAEECGLFRVPKVLDYDDSKGELVLERLYGIAPVRDSLAFDAGGEQLAECIGSSLAAIHGKLRLPQEMIVPLREDLRGADQDDAVFLHGDFTVANIFVNPTGPSIAVLDWHMTEVDGGVSTYGTRYFDLAVFINTLFYRPMHRYLFSKPAARAGRAFLESYFQACGSACIPPDLVVYLERLFAARVAARRRTLNWTKRFLLARSHAAWGAFIQSLHGEPSSRQALRLSRLWRRQSGVS